MSTRSTRTLGPELALASSVSKKLDALVVGVGKTDGAPVLIGVDVLGPRAEAILAALIAVGATGRADQVTRIPAPDGVTTPVVVGVGLGAEADRDAETVRQAAGTAARSLTGFSSVATTLSAVDLGAAAEGFFLGSYQFGEFEDRRVVTIGVVRGHSVSLRCASVAGAIASRSSSAGSSRSRLSRPAEGRAHLAHI